MSFSQPWFLLLLPFLTFIMLWRRRRGAHAAPMSSRTLKRYEGLKAKWLNRVPFLCRFLGLTLLVFALARPQTGGKKVPKTSEGLDIVLAVDTSGSMRALDFILDNQRQNRLEVVKNVVGDFVKNRPDDRIGMVVFGTEVFTQAPLTLDHEVLALFLDQLEIGMAGDATSIGDAIGAATFRLKDLPNKSKILILLTDGENTSGALDPIAAAKAAAALGIRIYTIGVGTTGRVPMPDSFGNLVSVEVRLDEKTLGQIAELTKGAYFRASDTSTLRQVYRSIDKLEKAKEETPIYVEREERYPEFVKLSAAFLVFELFWMLTPLRRIP